jgi:molybdenum cofactor cytidylyltransferase
VAGGEELRRRPAVCVPAVVLAAGRATRMGVQKLLLPLDGRPLVLWAVDAALASTASRTIVVVGHESTEVTAALGSRAVTVVPNPDYAQGMSSSLRVGILGAGTDCDAVVVLLGDQPFVTSALVDALIQRYAETGSAAVRPCVHGRPANPVLLSAALFPEVLAQRGDVGGREVLDRHAGDVSLLPVDDPLLLADVDGREDYEAVRSL